MKKVIKTGSSLFMKIGAGSALFGATIASSVAQAQTKVTGQEGGVTEIAGNILGEGAAGLELFQAGAAILGAGMIVAALISWFLRSKKRCSGLPGYNVVARSDGYWNTVDLLNFLHRYLRRKYRGRKRHLYPG